MILRKLFNELNKGRVKYCVLRKYKTLPETPIGDVDIAVEKRDFKKMVDILFKLNFKQYPFVNPHYFFFYYEEKKKDWLKVDVIKIRKLKKIRLYKGFYVVDGWDKRIKKPFYLKIYTNLARKVFYLLNPTLNF